MPLTSGGMSRIVVVVVVVVVDCAVLETGTGTGTLTSLLLFIFERVNCGRSLLFKDWREGGLHLGSN